MFATWFNLNYLKLQLQDLKFKMFQTKINHGSRVFHILRKPTSRHHHLIYFKVLTEKNIAQNHSSTKFQHFQRSFATVCPKSTKRIPPKKTSPAPVDTSHVCASSQSYKPVAFPATQKNTKRFPTRDFPQGIFHCPVGGSEVLHHLIGSLSHDLQGFEKNPRWHEFELLHFFPSTHINGCTSAPCGHKWEPKPTRAMPWVELEPVVYSKNQGKVRMWDGLI